MALNLGRLKEAEEQINNRGNDSGYFSQTKIGEETDIRILPPTESMNELYFFEEIGYWINGKRIVSSATFGEPCVITEEISAAKKLKDADIDKLLADKKKIKKSSVFLVPILLLNAKFKKSGKLESYQIVDNAPKILQCGTTLIKSMNKIITGRQYQNETEDGICDRVEGRCLILSKTGKDLDTVYSAMPWTETLEIEEEEMYEKVPDVVELTKKKLLSDDEARGIIRNFLYGEPLVIAAKPKAEKPAKVSLKHIEKEDDEDEDEEELVVPVKRTKAAVEPKAEKKSKKSLLARLEDVDEEE